MAGSMTAFMEVFFGVNIGYQKIRQESYGLRGVELTEPKQTFRFENESDDDQNLIASSDDLTFFGDDCTGVDAIAAGDTHTYTILTDETFERLNDTFNKDLVPVGTNDARIYAIAIKNVEDANSSGERELQLIGAATNPLAVFTGAGEGLIIPAGGFAVWFGGNSRGIAVSEITDQIQIINNDGANTVQYELVVVIKVGDGGGT